MSAGQYAVCPRCQAAIEPDTLHTCAPAATADWQWLRCLKTGKFYPDYAGTTGPVGLRYCAADDLIFVKPDDVNWLLDGLLCERYAVGVKTYDSKENGA